jgi:lipoprotein-anchoring transpeptidase ErfK/SrfK
MSATSFLRHARPAALGGVFCLLLSSNAFSQSLTANDGSASVLPPTPANASQSAPASDDDLVPVLRRQIVAYSSEEPPGTVVIDTAHTFLYLTLGGGKALRYGIGVGRKGFTWSGVEKISRKSEWPDWIPPAEMIARQPYLPRWVGGGPGNPLGARALYLGNSDYRIHGTNNPASIGKHVSSGCIRMRDADVIDLYDRVGVGTKVVVLASDQPTVALDDRGDVSVSHNAGVMTARVSVAPTPVSTGPTRARVEWNGGTSAFGLY